MTPFRVAYLGDAAQANWPFRSSTNTAGERLERLLNAAERMLDFVGLEGATVPAIAAGAGVSVGNVYKRFPDKDALLRAVYERFFTEQLAANQFALDPAKWADTPTIELVATLVAGMVEDYRSGSR